MKSPLRFFLQSVALALMMGLFLFCGSYLYTRILNGRLDEAIRSCELASKTELLEIQRIKSEAVKDVGKAPSTVQAGTHQKEPSTTWDELEKKYSQPKNTNAPSSENQNQFDIFDKVATAAYRGMNCEPSELYALRYDGNAMRLLAPHYRSIIALYGEKSNIENYEPVGYFLIFLILLVGVLPALWYFFLRRLKEVAAAIRGS